jgi:hypothetical protein
MDAMPARKSRFSLGDLMIFIALGAIYAAPYLDGPYRLAYNIPAFVVGCLGLAVLVAHRRLSPWMWVIVVGLVSDSLFHLGRQVARSDPPGPLGSVIEGSLGSLFYVLGLGMTLRDVRRRLEALEDRAPG